MDESVRKDIRGSETVSYPKDKAFRTSAVCSTACQLAMAWPWAFLLDDADYEVLITLRAVKPEVTL
jgi:hypothetical protein